MGKITLSLLSGAIVAAAFAFSGVNVSTVSSLDELKSDADSYGCVITSGSDCMSTATGTIYFHYENR